MLKGIVCVRRGPFAPCLLIAYLKPNLAVNAISKLFAALAVLLNLTAYSQTLVEFTHEGTQYVGVPVPTWEQVVARRLDANDLNRNRARVIAFLHSDVKDVEAIAETYRKDAEDYRERETAAIFERDQARIENNRLQKLLRRRTPWATAMKIHLGILVVGAAVFIAAR